MRIAIVRLTSLGDVVHTLPVAHAIRQHDPSSYIVWVVEEREQTILQSNPAVDEVVLAPTRRWRRALGTPRGIVSVVREWWALRRRFRDLHMDVAIDVQGLLKSSLFLVLIQAPLRVGFGWRHAREPLSALFTNRRVDPPKSASHVVDKNLSLLGPLGIPVGDAGFPLPAMKEPGDRVAALLLGHGVKPQDRLVVLMPATRGRSKQWPLANYLELARRLVGDRSVRILLVGAPDEEPLLIRIADGLKGAIIFTGPLEDLLELLRRADLTVGNDTGPLHIAAALGRPTIGLFGPTRGDRNGPYGARARSLQSPTRRMRDLTVGAVLDAAIGWLERPPDSVA
jgi:heptosyltransferase-1